MKNMDIGEKGLRNNHTVCRPLVSKNIPNK